MMKLLAIVALALVATASATSCSSYVSGDSSYGTDTCDSSYDMPYPFSIHFHPTYDTDSGIAVYQLQEAFMQYFGVTSCNVAGESTLVASDADDQKMCFMATAKASGACSTSGKGSETTFPECQFGIHVPTQLLFDETLMDSSADYTYTKSGKSSTYSFSSNLSPWRWMEKYKDGFSESAGSSTTMDIDIFVHASLTCPKLAHGTWGTFVYPYSGTSAATGITGDYGSDGCYGKTCDGCPSTSSNGDSSYTDSSGCCHVGLSSAGRRRASTLPDFTSSGFTTNMGRAYYMLLSYMKECVITDTDACESMSSSPIASGRRRSSYSAFDQMSERRRRYVPTGTFPAWVFTDGCSGDGCSKFDDSTAKCPSTCGSGRRRKCKTTTTCSTFSTLVEQVEDQWEEGESPPAKLSLVDAEDKDWDEDIALTPKSAKRHA